ncbi:unnamed protein product [Acanthoscelides obtectus]|uniref:Uncharacterized protein n=1 Tax=Acanthoscelides obtectus TaxID=200917 RepID=A0A9P0Q7T3_ACAOB|nr:unnamed protein product [Acanthoscelides obtectus]CAK1631356.1 hypothetical protein AOBTE_LOCUS6902 [Acanthoscelides obtectus]
MEQINSFLIGFLFPATHGNGFHKNITFVGHIKVWKGGSKYCQVHWKM